MNVTRQQVQDCLKDVLVPGGKQGEDIVSRGIVSDIFIDEIKLICSLVVPSDKALEWEETRKAAHSAIMKLDNVKAATVVLTAEKTPESNPQNQSAMPRHTLRAKGKSSTGLPVKRPVDGIDRIIAVASGKGGVGKSTTAVNLALAMVDWGLNVGVLDADVYGPSMARLLAISDKPQAAKDGKKLLPVQVYGLQVMSMAFLVEEDMPVVWRGPMVIKALNQMLREVVWSNLDLLVVDMPPGTGDAQLTMAQQVPLAGAVIVSTPQDLALIDARKGINMFTKVDVPILGIIENMSVFICPECGHTSEIFGHGGAREEAISRDVEFLGEIPLHMDIRKTSDGGCPVVTSFPDSSYAKAYQKIAKNLMKQLHF